MKNPKLKSILKNLVFNFIRVLCLVGILALATGAILTYQGEVQASRPRSPVQQGEAVVQFRAIPRAHTPEQTNEYTIMEDLVFPQLLISFENNTVSGSASASTSFFYLTKDWTGEATIDIDGTYDLETGVVAGTYDYFIIYRFPPDPGFHDIRKDVHYYGTFYSYFEDPVGKFSLEDATLDLMMPGTVATDKYYDSISDVPHSENPASLFIQFVRETPDASDCTPSVYGLDPLIPGDVISPGASYTDQDGNDVNIIGERWFFNGQDGNSVVWDGNPVTVELQWTCLGHQAHSQTFEIAAYQPLPPPAGQDPNAPVPVAPVPGQPADPGSTTGPGLVGLFNGLGLVLVGLGGVAGVGGAIGLGIPLVKTITAGPAVPKPVTPRAQAPSNSGSAPTSTPGKLDPKFKKPWEAKIDNLIDQRTNIQANIQPINDQIIRLTRLYKNNILKVIMKGGLETGQILFDAATGGTGKAPNIAYEIGKKALGDKGTDKAYQKHDTAKDGKNVVDVKNLIDDLKAQREGLRNQVKDCNREIKSIQTFIHNEF